MDWGSVFRIPHMTLTAILNSRCLFFVDADAENVSGRIFSTPSVYYLDIFTNEISSNRIDLKFADVL